MAATAAAFSAVSAKLGLHGLARSTKSATAGLLCQPPRWPGDGRWRAGAGASSGNSLLAPHAPRLPAGREDSQTRAPASRVATSGAASSTGSQLSSSRSSRFVSEEVGQARSRSGLIRQPPAHRAPQRWSAATRAGIRQRREIDEDDPVGKRVRAVRRRPRSPVASCPRPRSSDREQAHIGVLQSRGQRRQLRLAPDEPGQRSRQGDGGGRRQRLGRRFPGGPGVRR